ncbi:protein CUSTOS [Megalops cyprinoides]|uniref:protein CUSTOS n=1 Tax=Megalops cyprinoides TaxID=118141 RepID=UPI00186519E8|nr:protein CUSTOS [Megalops cyprinoides]
MAAPGDTVHEEDSSSEDEDQEKFKEAAWSFGPGGTNGTVHHSYSTGGDRNDKPSRRVKVSQHDHDGNELQTTPEFRAHVAKKLGALLDSCISDGSPATSTVPPGSGRAEDEDGNEDEGFRLFSTSVPGLCVKEPSPPVRRRPIPSSSDSDSEMEMRLKEAAVSVTDLLPPSCLPSMPQSLSSPAPLPDAKKKKKKKKAEDGGENGEEGELESGDSIPKKKKKKKKQEVDGGQSREEGDQENGSCDSIPKKKKKRKPTEGGSKEGETETNGTDPLQNKEEAEEQGNTEKESFPQQDSERQPQQEEIPVKKKMKKKKSDKEGEE